MTDKIDGFINRISVDGKLYALQCQVVEVYPIKCPKCGGPFKLRYGNGKCPYCDTHYTTQFKLQEV